MYKIEEFLKDLTFGAKYEFLDNAKNKNELEEIAKKRGIKIPCHDLSVFKCTYAYVDVANKNGCILVKSEVEKALNTLIGKAVDFDHMRKRVVGHWIDAKIEKNEIIAYGVFYKGNFDEDYILIKEMMEKDILAISFEAWGAKEELDSGEYNLKDIEFAGGALLIKTSPAFPGSQVLEMSNKERVLEFASIMTAPAEFLHSNIDVEESVVEVTEKYVRVRVKNPSLFKKDSFRTIDIDKGKGIKAIIGKLTGKTTTTVQVYLFDKTKWSSKEAQSWVKEHKGTIEESKLHLDQLQAIYDVLSSVECPSCKAKSLGSIEMIDLEKQMVRVKCWACDAIVKADLTPVVELTKKGKKIEKTDISATTERNEGNKKMKEEGKYPKFTVKCDSCGNIFESTVRGESTPCEKCGGATQTIGDQASIQEEEKIMKEKIEGLEKELATLKEESTKVKVELTEKSDALNTANATIEELKKESEETKVKIEEIEKAKAEEVKTAKADAIKMTERKAELGEEFSKDVDLLDDKAYELAKARKELSEKDAEIASLKEGKPIVTDLTKGSEDKTADDELTKKHSKVRELAYGKKE